MDKLVSQLLGNPDISRVLCIAIAAEARRTGQDIDVRELAVAFSRVVRSLDRTTFTDECRKLSRLGPDRYLRDAGRKLEK